MNEEIKKISMSGEFTKDGRVLLSVFINDWPPLCDFVNKDDVSSELGNKHIAAHLHGMAEQIRIGPPQSNKMLGENR